MAPKNDDPKAVLVKQGMDFSLGGQQFARGGQKLVVGVDVNVELARHSINLGWADACAVDAPPAPAGDEKTDKGAGKGAGKDGK